MIDEEQKHSYYTKTNGISALHSMRHRDGNAYGVTDLKFGGSRMSHYYKCKYFCQQERAKIKKLLKQGTLETLDVPFICIKIIGKIAA